MRRTLISILFCCQLLRVVVAQQTPNLPPSPPPKTPTPAADQKSPDDQGVVRITTNPVQIDAVVTDKNGKRVVDQTDLERLLGAGVVQMKSGMVPGEYVIQIVVRPPAKGERRGGHSMDQFCCHQLGMNRSAIRN